MRVFPAFFPTEGRVALVIGGGELAARKLRLLLKSDAHIRVFASDEIVAEVRDLENNPRVTLSQAKPTASDMTDVSFAIVATEDEALIQEGAALSRRTGVPVNVVDRPELCDFTVPAIVDRGDIAIGIASGGAAPVLTRNIRQSIEAALPARLGDLARFAKAFRGAVAKTLPAGSPRKAFWERVFDGPIGAAVLAGRHSDARTAMVSALNGRSASLVEGRVALVGAGPGDPELLTIKALNVLRRADIVYFDSLVGDGVLDLVRRDAARVYVGKRKGDHAVPQHEIQDRMIASARDGQFVVRLKGGDPFVFGRGGEEIAAVMAAGIPVDIVPGITAAIGAGASAGLPLTHRDYAQAVTFVTGHDRFGLPELDWRALSADRQTVVVYMGVGKAGEIAAKLIKAGAPGSRPVAVIENATTPRQKTAIGRLAQLERLVIAHDIEGPALIVIGDVAALANQTAPPDIQTHAAMAV